MVRFLFWNTNGKPLQERLAKLVRHNEVDVFVLAERAISSEDVLAAFSDMGMSGYRDTFTLLETIAVYSRLTRYSLDTLEDDPDTRVSLRRIGAPSGKEFLLAVAHFPSKLYWYGDSQAQPCILLADRVRRWEQRLGHSRTVVVGDLNMNPFETGIVASYGLHATMARDVASRGSRKIQGQDYPFFYNPMWGHFGDALDGPPGTYYDSRAEAVTYFWNIFDQVLIRPSLIGAFRNETLKILDSDGMESLGTVGGLPDREDASDHYPIVFELDL